MTREEYELLIKQRPHLKPTIASHNTHSRVCATKQEQPKGKPLERATQRKDKSGARFEICFRIYATRPQDWDNPYTKIMQDLLVRIGILHDDAWDVLQGRVISCKARNKEEETVIEISNI